MSLFLYVIEIAIQNCSYKTTNCKIKLETNLMNLIYTSKYYVFINDTAIVDTKNIRVSIKLILNH